MATVYLARDRKHDRLVAVKVLRPELAAALGTERFLREIQIAAKLSHPHILPLYDSGEADGLLFFVMPYVEGESLRQRLEREGRLPVATAVQLTAEVAAALDYAHQQGIVHRDIKPENILLHTGQAIVADFGIARAIDAAAGDGPNRTALTATGVVVGTPLYMSPEQVVGDPVDGRTDVYALGCVSFEMLAGTPPFTGPNAQAVLARHTLEPAPSLRKIRADVPVAVERSVAKALAKAPDDRFKSAAAFRNALTGAAPAPKAMRWRVGRRATITLTLLAASVAVLVTGYVLRSGRPAADAGDPVPSVAVLAFKNIGDDSANEPFSDGMSDEITTALGRVEGLRVAARSSAFSFKGRGIVPREIGKQLQVRYVLDGGVRVVGNRRRVSVQLIDVVNGNELWSEDYDRDARDRDVFAVQDSIARAIVASLRVHLSGPARAALTSRSTENPEAHDLYLKGRFFWNQRWSSPAALQRSIGFFQQAIALDSGYARAWAGLADAYSLMPAFGDVPPTVPFANAKAAAQRAVTLDSTLADAHTSLAIIAEFHDWDWAAASREFDKALALDSTEPHTHLFRAWLFVCQGQFDAAVTEMRTAQRLDPLNQVINTRLGTVLLQARRYPEAERAYRQALALDATNVPARTELGLLLALQHRLPEALATFRTLGDTTNLNRQAGWMVAAPMAYVYGVAGRRDEAIGIQRHLERRARTHYIMPQTFVWVALGLGDTNQALDWMERGVQERSFLIVFLAWPVYDPLRGQPRFQRIVRAMGVTLPPILNGAAATSR